MIFFYGIYTTCQKTGCGRRNRTYHLGAYETPVLPIHFPASNRCSYLYLEHRVGFEPTNRRICNPRHWAALVPMQNYSRTPNLRRIVPIGQNIVIPYWNKFKPTNAVTAKNQVLTNTGLASMPNSKLIVIIKPATIWIIRSTILLLLLWNTLPVPGIRTRFSYSLPRLLRSGKQCVL